MVPEIEAIAEVNAFVAIMRIVHGQGLQDSKFDPRCISVFLNRAYDFDGTLRSSSSVVGFDDFAECTLAQ